MSIFSYPFMVNAFRAGTIVAVLAGALGWFVVLRAQTFAAHTQSVVGFPGATGAVLIGLSPETGFYAFCIGASVVMGLLPSKHREESAAIGTLQAALLATGYLFSVLSGKNLSGAIDLLFGSFLGITSLQVWTLLFVAIVAMIVLGAIGRPLLYSSIQPDVAQATGISPRRVGFVFLLLLGASVAAISQITGALLVFALLVIPAATARTISMRPYRSIAISIVIAVVVTWASLFGAYYSNYRTGVFIAGISFVFYLSARIWRGWKSYGARRRAALQ
ncbi:MAG: metal ABC transporter permease [Actinomycetota bacterium]